MGKKQSIASFIEKLPMDGSVGDCESTLLTTNMDYVGGGVNGTECSNSDKDTCEFSTNKNGCINTEGACKHASNVQVCQSTGIEPKPGDNSATCGKL